MDKCNKSRHGDDIFEVPTGNTPRKDTNVAPVPAPQRRCAKKVPQSLQKNPAA